jgi:hypothetical protein
LSSWLSIPSILATSIWYQIAKALIAEKDTGKFGQTFQDLRKEHGDYDSSFALDNLARQGHPGIVATCLRAEQDPFPSDKMCVSGLVHGTLEIISLSTRDDNESFVKVITSFKSTDVKPLAAIRDVTLCRSDSVNVLKGVMDKSPELITDTLPSWLASHRFDRNSIGYEYNQTALEGAFKYLASFATESILEKALSIVKANEHLKINSVVWCCNSRYDFPQDLVDKLTNLLELMKARNAIIKGTLQSLLPTVLVDLMLDYAPN